MSKKKKIILITTISIILIIGIIVAIILINKKKTQEEKVENTIEVLDKINGYDYNLEDRDTEIFKEKFNELKEILESDNIDDEKYASLISELFVIDLYTLDNKVSKYDIGGIDYLFPEDQEKFKTKVLDTLYKLVEDNATNNRKQTLPKVSNTEVSKIENTTYQKGTITLTGYNVFITIDYENDLGYDDNVKVTVVKENEKIYIVALTPLSI